MPDLRDRASSPDKHKPESPNFLKIGAAVAAGC